MKYSFFPLLPFIIATGFSAALHAIEPMETTYNWPAFILASEARFQAQFERVTMMSIQDESCQQDKEVELLQRCLENDVFVRQAIEQYGLSVKDYARHWQALQSNNQRFVKAFRDYERLKTRWR